jgi:hypothetical protein
MKTPAILPLLAAALIFLPCAAGAAEEPEAVYAKFHRAAMAGDLDEMLKYGPAQRRAEMRGLSDAHREAALKMVQLMMPRAFKLERKTVNPNGRATLIVSGPTEDVVRGKETVYGIIKLVMENGEWKVDDASWGSDKPAILATPKPAAQPAADNAAKGAVSMKGAQAVGSPPGRKLGEAKPECVYKPVMTAEDMERCR